MSEMQARARNTDPATSHLAALQVEKLGRAGSQRRKVYDAVLANPGMTSFEVDVRLGFDREVSHRRLPELRDAGFLKTGKERLCSVRKILCLTWWPAEAPEMKQLPLL